MYKNIFSIIFFFGFLNGISIESELDKNIGFIGDIINWSVRISELPVKEVQFPDLDNFDNNISIRNQSFIKENGKIIGIEFELMVWDTGYYVLPEYGVNILNKDGSIDYSMYSNPLEFKIESILETLASNELRPIISPIPVKNIFPIKMIILFISLTLVIIAIIWVFRQRKVIHYKKADYTRNESAEQRANRRLNDLDINGLSKAFYIELSHISREYFELKYFVRALEMTTEEIENFRNLFPVSDKKFSQWYKFLIEADKVKFAKKKVNQTKMIQDNQEVSSLIN